MEQETDQYADRPFGRFFRELCTEKGKTVADVAAIARHKRLPLAKSTLRDLHTGKTWAPRPDRIAALQVAMNLDADQTARLKTAAEQGLEAQAKRLRDVAKEKGQQPVAEAAEDETGELDQVVPPRLRPSSSHVMVVVACLALVAVTLGVVLWFRKDAPSAPLSPSASPTACTAPSPPATQSAPPLGSGAWQATVANTWSSSRCKDLGVRPRVSPRRGELTYPGYHIGDTVVVICSYPQGLQITDKDTSQASTLWYGLDDGRYLNALFLHLQGQPGTRAPADMPTCKIPR